VRHNGGVSESLRISVVIPVRDDASMLEVCLTALASQTRQADEIIVVDNGSSDESAAIAATSGARVIGEPVQGIPRASAAGYDAADGDIIARLDADSRPEQDWLERIEQTFLDRPDVDFLTGEPRFYGGTSLVNWAGRHLYIGGMYAVLTPLLGHAPLFGSSMAMRGSAWRSVSGDVHRDAPSIHDDFDLSYHVGPDMTVLRDRDLIVNVSARPFSSWQSLRRRLAWVLPTVRLHWPEEAPGRRLAARRAARGGKAAARQRADSTRR
jgi:glycosyltransferase involved in cell wall biosynthesis